MGLPRRDEARHTYRDYCSWPEDVRYELVDGVAYQLSPTPPVSHQVVAGEIYRQVANQLMGRPCRPYIAPVDVRLPKGDEADDSVDTVVQPDVFILCDPGKLDVKGVRGAPDWIAEVLSPSTAGHDQIVKLAAYERAGVRELWFVHPADRIVSVYRLQAGAFGRPNIVEAAATLDIVAVPGVTIDWSLVFPSA